MDTNSDYWDYLPNSREWWQARYLMLRACKLDKRLQWEGCDLLRPDTEYSRWNEPGALPDRFRSLIEA